MLSSEPAAPGAAPSAVPSGGAVLGRRTPPVIELRGVRAGYGRIEVLHGIDLALPAGRVMALLGPNGAGKSTALKVASGRLVPTSGCFHVLGRHVNAIAPDALARAGVCTIPEGRAIFPNLTVSENLRMMTYGGLGRRELENRTFARFPRLAERRRQTAGTLSGGEQQMLAMARSLSTEPAALLLDEISMGLAPIVVDELYALVAQIAAEGVAILLTEQFARAALSVADHVALVTQGRIVAQGRPDELPEDLASAYLGGITADEAPAGAATGSGTASAGATRSGAAGSGAAGAGAAGAGAAGAGATGSGAAGAGAARAGVAGAGAGNGSKPASTSFGERP